MWNQILTVFQYIKSKICWLLSLDADQVAVILSFISLIFVYIESKRNKRNFILDNAPLFLAENETLEIETRRSFTKLSIPDRLGKGRFFFDRRTFMESYRTDTCHATVCKPYLSIILDLTENVDFEKAEKKIGYCKLNMRNVGYPMISFKIQRIMIHYIKGHTITLYPEKEGLLTQYIEKNETCDILVSVLYEKGSQNAFFDDSVTQDNEFAQKKLDETNGKLFNIPFPSGANRFDKIVIDSVTTNIFNYSYEQRIELIQENDIVHANTYLLNDGKRKRRGKKTYPKKDMMN